MGLITRVLFPLVAYFSVATVITLAVGYGYLRESGKLGDEQIFRIVSLIHGINLDEIAAAQESKEEDVPREEQSYTDRQRQMQVASLQLQAKKDDLDKQLTEFQAYFRQLNIATGRYTEFSQDVEEYLTTRKKEALEEGLVAVRSQWQKLKPKQQTKELLKKMMSDRRADLVILILNGMSDKARTDILKTFDTPEDLTMLYEIQKQMLRGHPESTYIDEKINELNALRQLESL